MSHRLGTLSWLCEGKGESPFQTEIRHPKTLIIQSPRRATCLGPCFPPTKLRTPCWLMLSSCITGRLSPWCLYFQPRRQTDVATGPFPLMEVFIHKGQVCFPPPPTHLPTHWLVQRLLRQGKLAQVSCKVRGHLGELDQRSGRAPTNRQHLCLGYSIASNSRKFSL